MPHRFKCAHGRRHVEALTLAIMLMALMSVLLLVSSRNASAQTLPTVAPTADYRFQDTRSSSVGTAPALVDICDASPAGPCTGVNANTFTTATVDGTSRRVLSFSEGNGLKLTPTTGVVWNGTYTIVAQFEFDSISDYRRIIDFKNGTSDNGLYVHDGNLEFFRSTASVSGTNAPIAPNTYVEVVLTRNSSGTVAGYVDGELQFSFSDYPTQTVPNQDAVIDTNNALRFFRDNESGGATGEVSAGSVARIRLYDEALPTTFTVNSTGDQNDADWPNGSFDQSEDGRCDVNLATAGNQCTLRAAFQVSNLTNGEKTIAFDIPGAGPHTITPGSELPELYNGAVTIDGYSQPGASANTLAVGNNAALKIELSGANAGATATGIRMRSWNSVVQGLTIDRWGANGVKLTNGSNSTIEGNYIGTDTTGTQDLGNGKYGVWLNGASNNMVGGTTPAARNVISGNGEQGIYVSRSTSSSSSSEANASGNKIQGNYIGTDKNGTAALANGNGVTVATASNNVVGGTVAGARNVISGNSGGGVGIGSGTFEANANPSDNRIQGNFIGTDVTGTQDLGNGGSGVQITHNQGDPLTGTVAGNNVVGGTTPEARNVISCNNLGGVTISFSGTGNNQVVGNYIGTDVTGTLDRGNTHWGVEIFSSSGNFVGGMASGAGNRILGNDGPGVMIDTMGTSSPGFPAANNHVLSNSISANDGPGVSIENNPSNPTAVGNRILRNSIFDNVGLGIDLDGGTESTEGVTRNDTGDADTGPNRLQNYPVITSAITSGGQTIIQGTINTTANDRLTLQFFSSSAADPSGFGEGKTYVGETTVDTNLDGNTNFSFTPDASLAAGQVVTATATSTFTSDTSEFSAAKTVEGNTAPTFTKLKPTSGSKTRDRTPLIAATVSDAQTDLAKSNIKLFVDGNKKDTFSYDASTDRLSYTSGRLSFGTHTVKIVATDGVLSATKSWSFKVVRG